MGSHPYTTDRCHEAAAVQLDLIRKMTPAQRVEKTLHLSSEMLRCARAAWQVPSTVQCAALWTWTSWRILTTKMLRRY